MCSRCSGDWRGMLKATCRQRDQPADKGTTLTTASTTQAGQASQASGTPQDATSYNNYLLCASSTIYILSKSPWRMSIYSRLPSVCWSISRDPWSHLGTYLLSQLGICHCFIFVFVFGLSCHWLSFSIFLSPPKRPQPACQSTLRWKRVRSVEPTCDNVISSAEYIRYQQD